MALKGRKLSEEHKEKIRQYHLGRKRPLWMRKRMSEAAKLAFSQGRVHPMLGKIPSAEHRRKISAANKGKKAWNKGMKQLSITGEKNYQWKGNEASYSAKHRSIYKYFGKANKCENIEEKILSFKCSGKSNNYHWAVKDRDNYTRNEEDYMQLCASCHRIYDHKFNNIN